MNRLSWFLCLSLAVISSIASAATLKLFTEQQQSYSLGLTRTGEGFMYVNRHWGEEIRFKAMLEACGDSTLALQMVPNGTIEGLIERYQSDRLENKELPSEQMAAALGASIEIAVRAYSKGIKETYTMALSHLEEQSRIAACKSMRTKAINLLNSSEDD